MMLVKWSSPLGWGSPAKGGSNGLNVVLNSRIIVQIWLGGKNLH